MPDQVDSRGAVQWQAKPSRSGAADLARRGAGLVRSAPLHHECHHRRRVVASGGADRAKVRVTSSQYPTTVGVFSHTLRAHVTGTFTRAAAYSPRRPNELSAMVMSPTTKRPLSPSTQ